jgi:hypothetical protein
MKPNCRPSPALAKGQLTAAIQLEGIDLRLALPAANP